MRLIEEESARLPSGRYFESWETEPVYDCELHVAADAPNASDLNDGTEGAPLKTIAAASARVKPGTRVLVHAGVYRETVCPPVGGESPEKMVAYQAAGDGEVVILASTQVKNCEPSTEWLLYNDNQASDLPPEEERAKIWQTRLDPDEFRGYNPFCAVNIIHDRLYLEYDKMDVTPYLNRRGIVFVDGQPLRQVQVYEQLSQYPGAYWVESNGMTVHFRLADDSLPGEHQIEISCREQCIAPEKMYLDYIKISGFTCLYAATGCPVPQRGAISCARGTHWIIEDCTVNWSNCLGIDCGGECWHRKNYDREFGYTIIRRNRILNSGVCGIAGLNATHMLFEDNLIQNTGWQRMERSFEAAAIKVHHSTDSLYRRNITSKSIACDAIWMDCACHNNRVTQNLFLDGIEARAALFVECSRGGENLFDNNVIWNVTGAKTEEAKRGVSAGWYDWGEPQWGPGGFGFYSEGSDYMRMVNNLVGNCRSAGYHAQPVPFRLHTRRGGTARDAKVFNNLFYRCGEAAIKFPTDKNESEGNCFVWMLSGYLRILFPQPEECLDLAAWQKFHGFDLTGSEAEFDIEVDGEKFTMDVRAHVSRYPNPLRPCGELNRDPSRLPEGKADGEVRTDYWGNDAGERRIPGPFTKLYDGIHINLDPRKITEGKR